MIKVTIYTDGGCRGNGNAENVGAYGIVMLCGEHRREIGQFARNTTNNIMELSAVVRALSELKKPCQVELYTDSSYVVNAIEKKWLCGWIKKGWITSTKKPVANKEIWMELIPLLEKHDVKFNWVKGHADNEGNNRCDAIANKYMNEGDN